MAPDAQPRADPIRKRYYEPLESADKISNVLFYAGALLSLVIPFVEESTHPVLHSWVLIMFCTVAVALFVVGVVIRLYLAPRAEDERRKDFLSKACGVSLAQEPTAGYYNNDLLKPTERVAAQVLENAYFTKSGALAVLRIERTKVAVYFTAWLVCVLKRDADLGWLVAASQALFSEQVLSKWIRLEWLRARAERIFDSVHQLFQARPSKVATFNAMAMEAFGKYESTKANAAIVLSTRIFEASNARWTAEWDAIKAKLQI